MKKILFAVLALLIPMCAFAQKADNAVVKDTVIHIYQMVPLSQPMSNVTTDAFYFGFANNKLSCLLPYIGSSHTAMMGGTTESGIRANGVEMKHVKRKFNVKKGYTELIFNFTNEARGETISCTVRIYNNGIASVQMQPPGRDFIKYNGQLGN